MKGTEKIIAHIQADAKAQADEILARAESRCAEIKAEYDAKAREAYSGKIREGVKACEEKLTNSTKLAEMESRKDILALKQELMNAAFDRARDFMLSLPEDSYLELLVTLAVRGACEICNAGTATSDATPAAAYATPAGEIILNAADREKYGPAVVEAANSLINANTASSATPAAGLTLSDTAGSFAGGLIVRSGSVEVNNTIELMVETSREDLSAEVAALLFENSAK